MEPGTVQSFFREKGQEGIWGNGCLSFNATKPCTICQQGRLDFEHVVEIAVASPPQEDVECSALSASPGFPRGPSV